MTTRSIVLITAGCVAIAVTCATGVGVLMTKVGRKTLQTVLSIERPADLDHPQVIDRAVFQLSYPGNWLVDTDEAHYDLDHLFTLVSPGRSQRLLVIVEAKPADPAKKVAAQVAGIRTKFSSSATQTPFARWGSYLGKGVAISGRMLGIVSGEARIFSHSDATQSFTVVEVRSDRDALISGAGGAFDLIARSFRLHNPCQRGRRAECQKGCEWGDPGDCETLAASPADGDAGP